MNLRPALAAALLFSLLTAAEPSIGMPESGVDLPMADAGGRPVLSVRVNGKGPFNFILDTGADTTVVDEDLVGRHTTPGEAPNPPMAEESAVKVESLEIGDALLRDVEVHPAPLSRTFGDVLSVRGVLSAASFPGYLLVLDYPAKRIRIHKGDLPAADLLTRFQYTAEQILPNVPLKVCGTEVRMHVDAGSPGGVTLPTRYMKELPLASAPVQIGRARTAAGEFAVWSAEVKGTIMLGSYKLEGPTVEFSDVNPIPGPLTGNLGYQTLRQFVITLDSKNRRIQFDR